MMPEAGDNGGGSKQTFWVDLEGNFYVFKGR